MSFVPNTLPPEKPLFFLHIPKTAGTTFTDILKTYRAPDETLPTYLWSDVLAMPADELQAYKLLSGHFHYDLRQMLADTPMMLTFLRDPVERVLSQYEQRRRATRQTQIPTHHDIKDFLADERTRPVTWNFQTRFLGLSVATDAPEQYACYPNLEYLMPEDTGDTDDAALLARAKERLRTFDFIGITERFDQSLQLLSYWLGWQPVETVTARRVASDRIQQSDLDASTLATIREYNALDLELYAYAQELFTERYAAMQQDLLTQHYQHTYDAAFTPTDTLHVDMSHVLPGTGWHAAEPHAEFGAYRWMSAPTAHLDVPLITDSALQVRLTVIDSVTQEIAHELRLQLDGEPLPTEIAYHVEESKITYTGVIPPRDRPTGRSRVSICIDEVLPGSHKIAHETRQLGVAVASLEVTPAHDA